MLKGFGFWSLGSFGFCTLVMMPMLPAFDAPVVCLAPDGMICRPLLLIVAHLNFEWM